MEGTLKHMVNIVGKKYRNLITGNTYVCIGYDGRLLTLQGIGKNKVTFEIAWQMVLAKYKEGIQKGNLNDYRT